ncbi:MAG: 30S ribosomal protein S25e [Metallosphaera yellowstonensis]|jgi:small subunit ribosomal protein S25e|uniref:Ribosomal protein S25 n=1 Tax=Metallosphaera yellowstonensis MK1 TaxID=671065 RepID=H2C703_9CREN|nr:30S ribosomal protein S25e [Metallosphaera yellowstonensis]EHP69580.1 ribosomal protein S25 [Metallosphaera yellowstonensis MK1]
MGGASKKPISNVEKRMKKEAEAQQKKEKKKVSKTGNEVISKNIVISDEMVKRVQEEIKKEKIITPYNLATKASITLSVAKRILKDLNQQGVIKEVYRNRRTAIYVAS